MTARAVLLMLAATLAAIGAPAASTDATTDLIRDLGDDAHDVRLAARTKLVALGPAGLDALVAFLDLHATGIKAHVTKLIAQLDAPSWAERERAMDELGRIGIPAAESLVEAMKSGPPEVRWRAKRLVEHIRERNPAEDERQARRYALVIELVAEYGDARTVTALERELDSDLPTRRELAAFALGRIGQPRSCPHLVRRLNGATWPLKAHLVWAIGRTGDAAAAATLLAIAEARSEPPYLRARAVGGAERALATAPAVPREPALRLVALARDPAWEVRAAAEAALAALAKRDGTPTYHRSTAERTAELAAWRDWAQALPPDAGAGSEGPPR